MAVHLDLRPVAGGDVGDGPARLLADRLLGGGQQVVQAGQRRAVQDHLGLSVVSSHNVAHGSQSSRHHIVLIVPARHIKHITPF